MRKVTIGFPWLRAFPSSTPTCTEAFGHAEKTTTTRRHSSIASVIAAGYVLRGGMSR